MKRKFVSVRQLAPLCIVVMVLLISFILIDDRKKPDESRFTPVVLAQDLDEPMVFKVIKNGNVYIAERKGALKVYDAITQTVRLIANIPVNTKYTSAEGAVREAEEGLMGMTLDPEFEKNNWIYLYYAHPTEKKHILTRWKIVNDKLVENSEKVLLEVATQREVCCHTGGGMTWDPKGNLFLTVGNNTGNQQGAQTDERPGRSSWDDQGHAGNSNDLRGKILRIHPEANGTYTIPAGNMFPKGTDKTRPEIYTMGHRNPWRISVDTKTGYIYWGEVGPDANEDSEIGPRGYDELNQAKKPGFFGWPWFVGNNQAFPVFDYATNKPLDKKDPKRVVNNSPNNTGIKELPATSPSFIYYPYGVSEEFPLVGTGSRSATGGPIYHRSDFSANAKRPWPAYFEGKWIATDLSRGWIMTITMDADGNYKSMERFLPSYHPIEPIDMQFGPEGDLYVLEYGSTWFAKSPNSQLVKIEYNGGNRKPLVEVATSKQGGTVPLKLTLSSAGTKDLDGDALKYTWKVSQTGGATRIFNAPNPPVTFTKPGVYTASLIVTDPKGLSNSKSVKIIAGNEAPVVAFNVMGNRSFFFNKEPLRYDVAVSDNEDGNLSTGKISPAQVAVSIDYASEGFDLAEVRQSQRSVDASTKFAVAQALMAKTDCKNCHNVHEKSVGPSFFQLAQKYKNKPSEEERLVKKIREGGSGVWGDVAMPAHPAITANDAHNILNYILNIEDKTISTLPVKGYYTPTIPAGDNGKGYLVLRAAYTDRGSKGVPRQTTENVVILKSPVVNATDAEILKGGEIKANDRGSGTFFIPASNGYIVYKGVDMSGIKVLKLNARATSREGQPGGVVEVRLGSPTGQMIGRTEVKQAEQQRRGAQQAPSAAQAAQDAGGKPVAPAVQARPVGPPTFDAVINPVNGKQDVYLVFKNSTATPIQPLFTLTSIAFSY
nr:PQQ-dependent sugar dehydrogenase [uncultured Mucilaginibacter sp.]